MKGVLSSLRKESGHKVNTSKSKLFVSTKTNSRLAHRLSQDFDIPLSQNLGYLSLGSYHTWSSRDQDLGFFYG